MLGGKIETVNGTCALEYTGVVTAVGGGNTQLAPGDRVVAMGPSNFSSRQRLASWQCMRLRDDEPDEVSHVPVSFQGPCSTC